MGQVIHLPEEAGEISAPEPLEFTHILAGFDSGEPTLDDWLLRRAHANQVRGASRTYVVCERRVVIGYYCLAAGAVMRADAIPALKRNMPDPIPVMVLGRLAVRKNRAGRRIGSGLLADAIFRTQNAAEIAGISAILVHALHERAAQFYLERGFRLSSAGSLTLMLPINEIKSNTPH